MIKHSKRMTVWKVRLLRTPRMLSVLTDALVNTSDCKYFDKVDKLTEPGPADNPNIPYSFHIIRPVQAGSREIQRFYVAAKCDRFVDAARCCCCRLIIDRCSLRQDEGIEVNSPSAVLAPCGCLSLKVSSTN